MFGALSYTPKDGRFDPWSGHMPEFQVKSPVGVHSGGVGGNHLMFLSHIWCSSPSLSKVGEHISLGKD